MRVPESSTIGASLKFARKGIKNPLKIDYLMYNRQFHHTNNTTTRESFSKPSMTEPDNAMSIPEIISRYMRGHGLPVRVLPDSSDQAALEQGQNYQDDPDMFSEELQEIRAREAAAAAAAEEKLSEEPGT